MRRAFKILGLALWAGWLSIGQAAPVGLSTLCPESIAFYEKYAWVLEAQMDGMRRFPTDPIRRGHALREATEAHVTGPASAKAMGFNAQGQVEFNRSPYSKLMVENVPELNTVRFRPKAGRFPAGSRLMLPLFHGTGAVYSHSGAMLQMLGLLTSQKSGGDFFSALGERGNRHDARGPIFIASEVIDQPFSGAGPFDPSLRSLDKTVTWLVRYFEELKRSSGLPLVPICRSGMGGLIPHINHLYPGLFAAMVLLSPEHPDQKIGSVTSLPFLLDAFRRDLFPPNLQALDWMIGLYAELNALPKPYYDLDRPFGNTPTAIFFGGKDQETGPVSRQAYRGYAERSRASGAENVHLFVFDNAEHDVFAKVGGASDARAVEAYNTLFWFLRRYGLGDSAAVPPLAEGFRR